MSNPERIQLRRAKGWRLQEFSRALNGLPAVKVDRTTRWGNPFRVGAYIGAEAGIDYQLDASSALREFKLWLSGQPCMFSCVPRAPTTEEIRRELADKNLACWCKLPKAGEEDMCHAAVLLRLANA
jgi:hypothetical protein